MATTSDGFDRVFDLIGGHGRYQWRLLLVVSLQKIFLTWNIIGYAFLGNVPDHWCHVPELENSNWTLDQIKAISIPWIDTKLENSETGQYVKCEYYNLNYAELLKYSSSYEEMNLKINFSSLSTIQCSEWDFDQSIYKSTVATEFKLVCGNRWKVATIQASYMVGGIIGSVTFGSLSDRFLGRRRTILTSLTLAVSAMLFAACASSYWMFLLGRVLIAVGAYGSMQNCFVLITEHADKKYRALLAMLELLPYAIGYMLLSLLGFYFREWWTLQLSFGLISSFLCIYYWVIPESPRWLTTQGHAEKALRTLYNIAKVNKYPEPNHDDLLHVVKQFHDKHQEQIRAHGDVTSDANKNMKNSCITKVRKWIVAISSSFAGLMRTPEIRKRSIVFWILFLIVANVYYGLVFSGNLTSDPYLLVFLGGLAEIPAYLLVTPFISLLGRRPTTIATFFLTGLCFLGLWKIPKGWFPTVFQYDVVWLSLAMLGKLFNTCGFSVVYLLAAEMYPTELRTTGIAVGFFAGRIGAIAAPYMLDLMEQPMPIFSSVSLLGGVISFLLPETKTLDMKDKVAEIELQAEKIKDEQQQRRQSSTESRRKSLSGENKGQNVIVKPEV